MAVVKVEVPKTGVSHCDSNLAVVKLVELGYVGAGLGIA